MHNKHKMQIILKMWSSEFIDLTIVHKQEDLIL